MGHLTGELAMDVVKWPRWLTWLTGLTGPTTLARLTVHFAEHIVTKVQVLNNDWVV